MLKGEIVFLPPTVGLENQRDFTYPVTAAGQVGPSKALVPDEACHAACPSIPLPRQNSQMSNQTHVIDGMANLSNRCLNPLLIDDGTALSQFFRIA